MRIRGSRVNEVFSTPNTVLLSTPPPDSDCRIRTKRLDLTPMVRAHAELMYPILADPSIYEFTGDSPPSSVFALADKYARWERRRSPDGEEIWLNWLVRERELAIAIGCAQATIVRTGAYVAWTIGTRWQRRGYASETARAIVSWLVTLGVFEIKACVNPGHTASQKVAYRAGLRRTNRLQHGEEVWVTSSE